MSRGHLNTSDAIPSQLLDDLSNVMHGLKQLQDTTQTSLREEANIAVLKARANEAAFSPKQLAAMAKVDADAAQREYKELQTQMAQRVKNSRPALVNVVKGFSSSYDSITALIAALRNQCATLQSRNAELRSSSSEKLSSRQRELVELRGQKDKLERDLKDSQARYDSLKKQYYKERSQRDSVLGADAQSSASTSRGHRSRK